MGTAASRYADRAAPRVERLPEAPRGSGRPAPPAQRAAAAAQEKQLISATAQGDRHAFETIYDLYAPAVFGLALKTLADRGAAEEAVQEIFLRVWQRAGTFDDTRSFIPWLLGIAHNYCIDELRRRRARPQPVYEDDEHPILSGIPDETNVSATVLHAEQRRIVAHALGQLPVEQCQAIKLAYFGGLTQGEIADRIDSPVGTIKTRLRTGLRRLRQILRDEGLIEES